MEGTALFNLNQSGYIMRSLFFQTNDRPRRMVVGCGEHSTFESVQAVRIDGQIGVRDLTVSANFEYPGFFVFVPDNAGWRE